MIQRIQTVYLLVVAVLMIVTVALPVGVFFDGSGMWEMTNFHYTMPDGTWDYRPCVMGILLVAAAVIAAATIFLCRKRRLQIRLTTLSTLLLAVYYLAAVYFIIFAEGQDDSGFTPSWAFCLPLVSIILNWMAIRGIQKDDMLVKSYDRIR